METQYLAALVKALVVLDNEASEREVMLRRSLLLTYALF